MLVDMATDVKICGLRDPDMVTAAVSAGARYVGLVFYPPSPRSISAGVAAQLSRVVPTGVRVVGLFVDPMDYELDNVVRQVPLDLLQLHGGEMPARVAEIKARFGIPVIKAVRVATSADLAEAPAFDAVADMLLFDAKPPPNVTALPGGNGIPFDWSILAGGRWRRPWMLSGGLTADNVTEAIRATGAPALDVSSGVELCPGVKDGDKIRAFMAAVRGTVPPVGKARTAV